MPLGTPEQYEQAIAAEHQELPREYIGRNSRLDIVQACEDMLLFADLIERPASEGGTAEKIERPEPAPSTGEWKTIATTYWSGSAPCSGRCCGILDLLPDLLLNLHRTP